MSELPLMLHGDMIEALVVGGGPVATRKTRSLLAAGARVRVVATVAGSDLRALGAAYPRLTIEQRAYASGDVGAAQIVIAATDDAAVNRQVAADAHASHRMVNVADDPARGNCRTAATHRAGGLVIGISAGGVPGAAARIRDSIAARFDARYGDAVATLASLRRRLLDSERGADWRLAASALIDERFCERVESGALRTEADRWR